MNEKREKERGGGKKGKGRYINIYGMIGKYKLSLSIQEDTCLFFFEKSKKKKNKTE